MLIGVRPLEGKHISVINLRLSLTYVNHGYLVKLDVGPMRLVQQLLSNGLLGKYSIRYYWPNNICISHTDCEAAVHTPN